MGVLDEIGEGNKHFFTGLLISDATAGDVVTEFKLHAFLDNGAINCAEFIPNIRSGSGTDGSKPTSLVFGDGATATANRSVAIGDNSAAKGEHSFAFGNGASAGTSAEEGNSIAIGNGAQATGASSVAIGNEAIASGEHAVSIGNGTNATGSKSFASGFTTTASGECSQASGNNTTASGVASVAEGHTTTASGECSHAGGKETRAIGACSAAFGDHTVAGHGNQFVIGAFNENKENNVFEIGKGTEDNQKNIFEVADNGDTTLNTLTASGDLEVTGTANLGDKLKVENDQVTVNPQAVFNGGAEIHGKLTVTTDHDLEVTGKLSTGADGTTIIKQLKIQGDRNFVYDSATGSLAIGTHMKTGAGAMALTSGSDASGDDAFVIGEGNASSGKGSAAFGFNNKVEGQYSFASGSGNKIPNALGENNEIKTAVGSVAIGSDNNTNGKNNAAVFGKGNVANSNGELVIGSFNGQNESGYQEYFAIGNGTAEKRSTAFKVASTGANKPTEAYIDGKPIATHVMEDTTFKQSLLDLLYPIGSVYVYSGSRDKLNVITYNGDT